MSLACGGVWERLTSLHASVTCVKMLTSLQSGLVALVVRQFGFWFSSLLGGISLEEVNPPNPFTLYGLNGLMGVDGPGLVDYKQKSSS
ncbi:hypothetical protein Bca4012_042319 [Brassica carinata]